MITNMFYSKIHRATVTDANLNYVGSITIDVELLEAGNLRAGQKVEILDINNGERFETYIIQGKRGQRDMCLNGAAARKVQIGDTIIVVAYAGYSDEELKSYNPTVVQVDENNNIVEVNRGIEKCLIN